DYMICAIPFSCLRRVEIWPSFRPEKQTVIQQLYYDPVVRIFFQTRRRFWTDEGLNGFADTDDPMEIWNPTFDQRAPGASGRGILMAYIEDGLTRRISAQSDTEKIRFGIAAVERAHPRLREFLEAVTPFSWAEQPWARGAYTYFTPGQITAWNALIRQPEGRIYFAGEHASSWPGWMQGALESGLRAAREVHQAP
ncbi:MAG TPA: NAD(P)/FAD-dependent oxidoreductase, partial [Candidatus Acidoferrales bacterium]|nr:NAD(P)/FAD-dependent oxidoreductase [Candidatus Acidoferrales bacterium]